MPEVKKYTYAQVKEHNTKTDVWIVINEKVYDVTSFLQEVWFFYILTEKYQMKKFHSLWFLNWWTYVYFPNQHPGGEEVLIDAAGKDGMISKGFRWIYIISRKINGLHVLID